MKVRTILLLTAAIIGVVIPVKFALDGVLAPSTVNSPLALDAPLAKGQAAGVQVAKAAVSYEDEYPRAVTPENAGEYKDRVFINNLGPNEYTPKNYVPPSYDPFNNVYNPGYDYSEQYPPLVQPNAVPEASFTVLPKNRSGLQKNDTATVGTELLFNASTSTDDETRSDKLMVRWDFETDGQPDTYFSKVKTARHTFEKDGDYQVTLEVLDKGGAVGHASRMIKIVNNTAPLAYQIAKTKSGTPGTIFEFDTGNSSDSQYTRQSLQYRFDWDTDGIYDTAYKNKTTWRHRFDQPGTYKVTMEVKDPEDLTATWYQYVSVIANTPPSASFTATSKADGTIVFDASSSTDAESPKKLTYRWDFNYSGKDDIVFDTDFTSAPKYNGHYNIPGNKNVRLQVKDADGAITEAFQQITATGTVS